MMGLDFYDMDRQASMGIALSRLTEQGGVAQRSSRM